MVTPEGLRVKVCVPIEEPTNTKGSNVLKMEGEEPINGTTPAKTEPSKPQVTSEFSQSSRTKPSLSPDKTRIPEGKPKILDPKDADVNNIRGTKGENEAAKVLAENGYKVEQLSDKTKGKIQGEKKPDFKVEEEIFDNYTPAGKTSARSIWTTLQEKMTNPKTGAKQADRFVINMNESKLTLEQMTKQFKDFPLEGLKEIILIKDGKVIHFLPFNN